MLLDVDMQTFISVRGLTVLLADIDDCPTSRRSGRHIIPPLAWWTTERILIDPDSHSTHIVCDSPVVECEGLTDRLSTSFFAGYCNSSFADERMNIKRDRTRLKSEILTELSVPVVQNETNSLASIIDST